jgi:hypothetical protein
VLILAGDVSDDLPTLRQTLEVLKARFAHVFFTPGEDLSVTLLCPGSPLHTSRRNVCNLRRSLQNLLLLLQGTTIYGCGVANVGSMIQSVRLWLHSRCAAPLIL